MVVLRGNGGDHDSIEKCMSTSSIFILTILKQTTCNYICGKFPHASLPLTSQHMYKLPNFLLIFFLWKIITIISSQEDYKNCACYSCACYYWCCKIFKTKK